ncbi:hypothetical protein [Streptomyces sp. NPDC053367]|uniref:hypothetical protein n=1 Tax=Streptomyces sp. NPDC053367 TaxID=3365700 RepID=UPI0037D20166
MTDAGPPPPEPAGEQAVSARLRRIAEALGPATLATALLVYFGYVATRARYEYFGVPVDLTGRSNQDMMLDGLEVVFVPAAMIFLGVLLIVGVHALVRCLLSRESDANAYLAYGFVLVGVLLIARAIIGIFLQGPETSVVFGVTPLALALGPAAVAYGVWIEGQRRGSPLLPQNLARNGVLCAVALGVAGLFWGSTQLAWAYGTGRGEQDAAGLGDRPEVVVDAKEPLDDLPPGVTGTRLRGDGAYRHRYSGFRLLLASGGRLFLVSPGWRHGRDQTIVLPYGKDIRVRLVPQT